MGTEDENIKFFYGRGMSARDISDGLEIPLHQVYRSLKRQGVARRTTAEQNRIRYERCTPTYNWRKDLAPGEKQLMIAGLMLYWGEGAKTQKTVDFANSDENALVLFLKFLKDICRVNQNKVRFYLYCFEDQSVDELIDYWCERLDVAFWQFTKPYIRPAREDLKRKMPHGVLHIRYSDKKLLAEILSSIKQLTIELSE